MRPRYLRYGFSSIHAEMSLWVDSTAVFSSAQVSSRRSGADVGAVRTRLEFDRGLDRARSARSDRPRRGKPSSSCQEGMRSDRRQRSFEDQSGGARLGRRFEGPRFLE
ncbi:MAG: hypothetical protein CL908_06210 [Deltaproteobacteria bacterium]|nr:hypothetical protein [Deltaproteobacteria bacterium]